MVAPIEGNEVTREGRQGVGVLHSTEDVGELAPGDPAEEREHREHGTVGGKDGRHIEVANRLNETTTDSGAGAVRQRTHDPEEPDASTRTSGSVGAGGGQPPSATRHRAENAAGEISGPWDGRDGPGGTPPLNPYNPVNRVYGGSMNLLFLEFLEP